MKRLAIYFTVLVGCLFIGLTTYYMVKNYEIVVIAGPSTLDAIYLNVGEDSKIDIDHEMKKTELSYNFTQDGIVSFNIDTGEILALKAGETKLTITVPDNENYEPFEFTIKVGNGSEANPFYIKNEEDLRAIGSTRVYSESKKISFSNSGYYLLVDDIELKEEWIPLCADNAFSGTFQGNYKTISNLTITEDQEYAGLFAKIDGMAKIDSLTLQKPYIVGRFDYAGSVVGVNAGSSIIRVFVEDATIRVAPYDTTNNKSYTMVGGIAGATQGIYVTNDAGIDLVDEAVITMCSFEGSIGTAEITETVIQNNSVTIIALGGITGFSLGATVYNTKSEIEVFVNAQLALEAKEFVREVIPAEGLCIDIGGIVGVISNSYITDLEGNDVSIIYPILKNNLSIMSIDNMTTSSNGIVGHLPLGIHLPEYNEGTANQRVIGNYFYSPNKSVVDGGCTLANSTTIVNSISALREEQTFYSMVGEPWDIGEVLSPWIIEEGQVIEINKYGLESAEYFDEDIIEINNEEEFYNYYEKMTSTLVGDLINKYYLRQHYLLNADIDLSKTVIKDWIPIGGQKFSFSGVFDGNGHTITFNENVNFNNDATKNYEFAGFFGQISAEGKVLDLTISGFKINYATYAGIISGVNFGKIQDCAVKEVEIQGAPFSGFITGVNYGIISGTKIVTEEILDSNLMPQEVQVKKPNVIGGIVVPKITVNIFDKDVFAGGITGINYGTISGIRLSGASQIIGDAEDLKTSSIGVKYFGGLVGYNFGKITQSYIESGNIYDHSTTEIYLGGIVGVNSGEISYCHAGMEEGGLTTTIYASVEKGSQLAGGIAAVISEDGKVSQSFSNVFIDCYTIGGFASYIFGEINESYVRGTFKGQEVGGFAVHMAKSDNSTTGGKIIDCYNAAKLQGVEKDSRMAGLVLYLRYPGVVEKCVMSSSFSGEGEKYYESFTNTREGFVNWITSWARPQKKLGIINNVVINTTPNGNTENSEVQATKAIISYAGQRVEYLTATECKNSKHIFEQMGFNISSATGWTIEIDAYPILTLVEGLDNVKQEI